MTVRALAMKSFLTEWYQPVSGEGGVGGIAAALGEAAAGLREHGQSVQVQLVVEVSTDEVLYAVFRAESKAAVIEVCTRSGLPVNRITDVQAFAP
ncbi:MAG TPA: hypothetical protein VJR50_15430 [Mycobacterium sp.]|nr:hypothetical protein [Mycobacterium sp.]